jgi:hypothetical protein
MKYTEEEAEALLKLMGYRMVPIDAKASWLWKYEVIDDRKHRISGGRTKALALENTIRVVERREYGLHRGRS